ncbi:MAG: hypothetical protein QM788_08405 [Roseateles sp.]|uniref:hypothetical protein n=1 Tax=Roseateles sp. TaxID=1971397 RepID=UPI0039EB6050
MMTQLMVEADAEARRCQTVTARHRALLPELAARAMRAGVPEAASHRRSARKSPTRCAAMPRPAMRRACSAR